jgi:hypothetical protein
LVFSSRHPACRRPRQALGPEPMTLARVKVTRSPPPTVPTPCMKRPVGSGIAKATARTFRDIVGSFPDLVRPTLLCACKQPAIPYIRLHHE